MSTFTDTRTTMRDPQTGNLWVPAEHSTWRIHLAAQSYQQLDPSTPWTKGLWEQYKRLQPVQEYKPAARRTPAKPVDWKKEEPDD